MKEHEKIHSVNALALILGIGRERLTKALADAGEPAGQQITVAKAFGILSAKADREKAKSRQVEAEADSAELDAAKKRGELSPTADLEARWGDWIIEQRKLIQSEDKWESSKLLVELSKIKLIEQ